ncbi:MAG: lipocalin family protein [Chitinophagaceae bacterium]|nr:lipocalin family protein [Chitinophagaceae bacterium]
MNLTTFKTIALLFIITSGIVMASCKKDKKDPEPEPTKKELLSHTWKITDVQTSDGTSIINLVPQAKCLKDKTVTLVADNTFVISDDTEDCSTPLEGSGSWSLTENDSKIKFEIEDNDPLTVTIKELSATTLKLSYYFADAPVPGDYIIVFQKQ